MGWRQRSDPCPSTPPTPISDCAPQRPHCSRGILLRVHSSPPHYLSLHTLIAHLSMLLTEVEICLEGAVGCGNALSAVDLWVSQVPAVWCNLRWNAITTVEDVLWWPVQRAFQRLFCIAVRVYVWSPSDRGPRPGGMTGGMTGLPITSVTMQGYQISGSAAAPVSRWSVCINTIHSCK